MKTMWNPADCEDVRRRLQRLTPESTRRWGKMTAPQMLAHLTDGMRMAIGEVTCAPKRVPLRYPPIRYLVIHVLPFPRGVPTAPELLARAPGAWGSEVTDLELLIERFAGEHDRDAWPEHPAFGRMSRRDWGVLVYRHIDHHFRQFGV